MGVPQKVLHLGGDRKLFAVTINRQPAFLCGLASQHQPDLPHRGTADGDSIDGHELIASLKTSRSSLAAEIGDRKNSEASIVFGTKNQSDHVEVGEVERAADFEINRGVGVVEANAIILQG